VVSLLVLGFLLVDVVLLVWPEGACTESRVEVGARSGFLHTLLRES
jgi:hypothetical protein